MRDSLKMTFDEERLTQSRFYGGYQGFQTQMQDFERLDLTPTEFLCQYHDFIDEVTRMLTQKAGRVLIMNLERKWWRSIRRT